MATMEEQARRWADRVEDGLEDSGEHAAFIAGWRCALAAAALAQHNAARAETARQDALPSPARPRRKARR